MIKTAQGGAPTFDGSHSKFALWWKKFRAFAYLNGFGEAIQETRDPDLPSSYFSSIDINSDEGKRQLLAKKRNDLAISSFTMAFLKEGTIGIITRTITEDWPTGLGYLVVKGLMQRYRPIDTITKVELRQKLNKITMKKGSDPSLLFEELNGIEERYMTPGNKIDEAELIAIVLDVATDEYQAVLTAEQRRMGDELTLYDLENAMFQYYRQMNRNKIDKKASREEGEVLLSAFQGVCYRCGKEGHRANQCNNNKGSKNRGRVNLHCNHCGKLGHIASNCWFKEENKNKRPEGFKEKFKNKGEKSNEKANVIKDSSTVKEFLLGMIDGNMVDEDIWIADSAATVHMTSDKTGSVNERLQSKKCTITFGNGQEEMVEKNVDIKGKVLNHETKTWENVILQNVSVMSSAKFNLFSITQMLNKGWKLDGDEDSIKIKKDNFTICFDIKIPTPKGMLYGMKLIRRPEFCGIIESTAPKMTYLEAHSKLGHVSVNETKRISKSLGWTITNEDQRCQDCAMGKAQQKGVVKKSTHQIATKNGERMFLDLSSVKNTEFPEMDVVPKPYWRIIVDERTQMKFSDFYSTKNEMVEPTCEFFNKLKNEDMPVKYLRCDNGGENLLLKKRLNSADWKLNVELEFTGRDTPQRNYLAEVGFHVISNRGRAIMHAAKVPKNYRYLLWREAFQTATKLDGLWEIELDGIKKSRYMHWNGINPKFVSNLRTWGEAGVVKIRNKFTKKIDDRGCICMFVGYPENHYDDTFRMWDPRSRRVHITRDISWLNKMYF